MICNDLLRGTMVMWNTRSMWLILLMLLVLLMCVYCAGMKGVERLQSIDFLLCSAPRLLVHLT
jgi:hypothetical protein